MLKITDAVCEPEPIEDQFVSPFFKIAAARILVILRHGGGHLLEREPEACETVWIDEDVVLLCQATQRIHLG